MLLYPFEKKLDLPTASIEFGDGESRQCEVVGQEDQTFAGLRIFEANAPQRCLKSLVRIKSGEHDHLIADQSRRAIDWMRVATLGLQVRLTARSKETPDLVEAKQSL